jgi:regulator of extracellular matrix RemA (YlzA/DUF370 family)
MLISIGYKSYVASRCIVEISTVTSSAARRLKRKATAKGLLINAAFGRQPKSMIIMKSQHIVLSALQPETLISRLEGPISHPPSEDRHVLTHHQDNRQVKSLKPADRGGRRRERDRRRFSYTLYIPERRSEMKRRQGKDRRKPDRTEKD